MGFEWDNAKSNVNKIKHGVNFEEALEIWHHLHVDVKNIAQARDESRSATLGKINNRIYVAIWTKRGQNIRIISVRRARKNEEKTYNQVQDNQRNG